MSLQRKQLAVLMYLALADCGRFVKRDTLIGVFWPESSQTNARSALRQPLHSLRRALGEDVILTRGDDDVAVNHELLHSDVLDFDRAVDQGQLLTAVELYRGPFLRGVYLKNCPEFEHWIDGQRSPRARANEEAIEQLTEIARSKGDHRKAAYWIRRLLGVDPLSGRVTALLMAELEAAGAREEAIRVGERHVANVARELGAEPDPRVAECLQRLRTTPTPTEVLAPAPEQTQRSEIEYVREALDGRYDVLEQIGAGIMAKVFLAWDPKLKRHVSVKVLRPEYRRTVGAERFLQEISIVAQFNHPNIVTLFDADELAGFLYYTMQHMPGDTLDDLIRREGRLPIQQAVRIACDVAAGLEYSHRHDVIHRDIKPRNIFVHEGVALVADFGLAIALKAGGKRITESGLRVGTPEYMSPEQTGTRATVDARSDIYSLGCVLYEMLTGELVYTGATTQAIIAKHCLEMIPSVRILRPDVSVELEAVVTKALAKAPGDRFATAKEFGEALLRIG